MAVLAYVMEPIQMDLFDHDKWLIKYQKDLRRIARKNIAKNVSYDEFEEIIQETNIKFFRYFRYWGQEDSEIIRIWGFYCKNMTIDQIRKRKEKEVFIEDFKVNYLTQNYSSINDNHVTLEIKCHQTEDSIELIEESLFIQQTLLPQLTERERITLLAILSDQKHKLDRREISRRLKFIREKLNGIYGKNNSEK